MPRAKLRVGRSGDPLEREADRMADRVLRGEGIAATPTSAPAPTIAPKCAACAAEDEGEEVRMKGAGARGPAHGADRSGAAGAADALSTPGTPLPGDLRAYFEPRFGRSFADVRLHLDAAAGAAAEGIDARAYTLGSDIAFAPGAYAFDTMHGRGLIAHELAHVAQNQPAGTSTLRRQPFGRTEREPFRDPRGPGFHSTLPYREAMRLNECIAALGEANAAYCRHEVLGEPLPTPRFRSVQGVTSPVPYAATDLPQGGATATIGRVSVTFAPDRHVQTLSMQNRAETEFKFARWSIGNITTRGGLVASFTGPAPPRVTVQTTYGPGASPTTAAGYGRGTTAADIRAGQTSLGFHEGRHGVNYIDFLEANPYPVFGGFRQQPLADFRAEMSAYRQAVAQYATDMARDSLLGTDCVGTTVDAFNAGKGTITAHCVQP